MKYLTALLLLFTACATPQPSQNKNSKFITVDFLNCMPLKDLWTANQLKNLSAFERKNFRECGITFMKVRVRKDRILSYSPSYSVSTTMEFPYDPAKNDSTGYNGPIKIEDINREHCHIFGEKTEVDVNAKCSDIDKEFQ